MADKSERLPENVEGKWYTTSDCIFCGACNEEVETVFFEGDDFYYVGKQPETKEEEEGCAVAMEECPADAIGDDGDE